MNANEPRTVALEILAKTGMWRSSYEPPLLRLLWRLGLDVPPPHFAGFMSTAVVLGTSFAVAWGVPMWLLVWPQTGMSFGSMVVTAASAGAIFGLIMAGYYAYGKRKHGLPSWRELKSNS